MKRAAALLMAFAALAQSPPPMPELRGTVTEYATNAPIAGAEVILYEFVTIDGLYTRKPVATVVTNSRGAFTFNPEHPGQFFAEARKPTYLTAEELDGIRPIPGTQIAETPLTLTHEPLPEIHFILIRPGGLMGTVIDEEGNPVANFPLLAVSAGAASQVSTRAMTDRAGVFLFPTLVPGSRLVRVGPRDDVPMTRRFVKEEAVKIDQDFEVTYWPGGVDDPALALPLDIVPGVVANVGTIRIRKVPFYRAHLTYSGECSPRESWMFLRSNTGGILMGSCGKDVVLDKLRPGLHTIGVVQGTQPVKGWAILEFRIDRENVEVPLTFTPLAAISGRFINSAGSPLPDFGSTSVGLRPLADARSSITPIAPASGGEFTIPNVPWPRHQVQFPALSPNIAVKEIRYNGRPVSDGVIDIVPGALLEIVIDNHPASLSGIAPPGSIVHLARWPFVSTFSPPYYFKATADASGKFLIPSLAAGEYRAFVSATAIEERAFSGAFAAAARVTLSSGEQQSIELKSR